MKAISTATGIILMLMATGTLARAQGIPSAACVTPQAAADGGVTVSAQQAGDRGVTASLHKAGNGGVTHFLQEAGASDGGWNCFGSPACGATPSRQKAGDGGVTASLQKAGAPCKG
jgi:hypothetical protein